MILSRNYSAHNAQNSNFFLFFFCFCFKQQLFVKIRHTKVITIMFYRMHQPLSERGEKTKERETVSIVATHLECITSERPNLMQCSTQLSRRCTLDIALRLRCLMKYGCVVKMIFVFSRSVRN